MTRHPSTPALREKPHRLSGNWKQIEQTAKRPGEWEQTRDGFRRVQ